VTSGSLLDLNLNVIGIVPAKISGAVDGLKLDECFRIQFQILQVSEEIVIHFDLKARSRATDGCLDVTLNPKSNGFLPHSPKYEMYIPNIML